MAFNVKRYTLEDYTKVIFDNTYVLTPEIIIIIHDLATILNVTNTQNTVLVTMKMNHRKDRDRKGGSEKELKHESWDTLRSFKSTVIEKKDGVEKTIGNIRICLNKISAKNYEKNKETIIQYIEENENDIQAIAQSIFDIASTNKFFSELYAELYKELIQRFNPFQTILDAFIAKYIETMYDIEYVNATDNYDKFCLYNKKNDARKATSVFITNLVKKGVLNIDLLINLVCQINSILCDYIEKPDKTNEVEEITENFYILVTETIHIEHISWCQVLNSIKIISQYKSKEKPSLSTRAIFKCMDILDKRVK